MINNSIYFEEKVFLYYFCESTKIFSDIFSSLLTGCFGSVSVEKLLGLLLAISNSKVSCVGLKRGMCRRTHLQKIHVYNYYYWLYIFFHWILL